MSAPELPWLGRLLASRYRLIARLGEGHIAEVYLARHVLIDRLSAIKVLRPAMGLDRGLRKLFLREARAVNRINHPNIVEISDYGETVETAYLVMEYVPGEPLTRLLALGSLGWERAARIGLQVALALSRAHEMNVIHRDIKPANVLLIQRRGGDDFVKLTDFGVAKLLDATSVHATTGLVPAQLTPGYVAPEMRIFGRLDARSDIFSLGVLVYEAACGSLPYPPDAPASSLPALRPLAETMPEVPAAFDRALARLLAPDPEDRPRDAFEVVAMLRALIVDPLTPDPDLEPPTERMVKRPSPRPGPRLLTMPFDRIGPLCERAFDRVARAVSLAPGALVDRDDLAKATDLVKMSSRLHDLVTRDEKSLAALEERARSMRSELGARLDELGRERSRAMGWASSVAERTERVRAERLSGAQPVQAMDALLWEEATLEHEEETSITRAEELAVEMMDISRKLDAENEVIEREKATLEAQLEGHVAALRALAQETWMVLDALADSLGLALSTETL